MIKETPLYAEQGIAGCAVCHVCQGVTFEVGIHIGRTLSPRNTENFIALLQCVECGTQLKIVHQPVNGTAPAISTDNVIGMDR